MIGRLIDKNSLEAFVEFSDGITYCVPINRLPCNSEIGDIVSVFSNSHLSNLNNDITKLI